MSLFQRGAVCVAAISIAVGMTAPAASAARSDGVLVQHDDGRITVEHRAATRGLTTFAKRATRRPGVRFAEPNRRYRAAMAPGDPLFTEQWSLADDTVIGAGPAWDQTTGGNVTVAVIDSGVDGSHPDLAQNMWTNPREIPGNAVDDDGNGFIDDTSGWNFVANTPNAGDDNGHGTHVAGIIGAKGGNGIGVAGVAWNVKIMPIKVLDAGAIGSASTLALGIRYAIANGAQIINLSVSGPGYSRAFEEAVQLASDSGVLVVGAAGNDGRSVDAAPVYPAGFQAPLMLAVAATAPGGGLSPVSNFGATVELAAPGQDIVSTAAGGGYERRTGTSMATPHVAGALVLLAAARPDLGAIGWREAILATARAGLPVSAGSLNLSGALQRQLGGQYRSSLQAARSASLKRSACSLRKAKALSRATRKRNRGKLYARVERRCTSSVTSSKLDL